MHPGRATDDVFVAWLSPGAGAADLEFAFSRLGPGDGPGIAWRVTRRTNDCATVVAELDAGAFAAVGDHSGLRTVGGVAVGPGERIVFQVGARGNNADDSTALVARVGFTPALRTGER
jgi:hypothetical protein